MIWFKLSQRIKKSGEVLTIASSVAGLVIALSFTGIYQTLECSILDQWFRLRPNEAKEDRIVVVEISESDISQLEEWPLLDSTLAKLLTQIIKQQPRVIGLDLYRDLKQGEKIGQQQLEAIWQSTPNIIGVEKAIGKRVKPPATLKAKGQVGMADLVLDQDGRVRRALISATLDNGEIALGLATKLALMYLEQDNITLTAIPDSNDRILGKTRISPLDSHEGGYVNIDANGYQTLLNYRGTKKSFIYTNITDVLQGNIPTDIFRDRLVLIGASASSLNDLLYTPYYSGWHSPELMPGVYVHANIASQIIASAIDGRVLLRGTSITGELLWILAWSTSSAGLSFILFQINILHKDAFNTIKLTILGIFAPIAILFSVSFGLFLCGWWLPTFSPLLALIAANLSVTGYYFQQQKRIAFTDGLTKVANRRFFDHYLDQQWSKSQRDKKDLAVILCDVDFFKLYNDNYGHQQGDICLQKVALALSAAVRNTDVVARYGGEEFVVILPDTNIKTASLIASRMQAKIKDMQIPHQHSQASKYITLSMGIASLYYSKVISTAELIKVADQGLYQAKAQGRDRYVVQAESEN
ncbi:diguanylate cyclase with Chase2 sensor [Chondrocystis sp. NIES-4102]|nr:diguanylate cyclase with Chase2 sensor [Chondrocystis sp. NIES-4102]